MKCLVFKSKMFMSKQTLKEERLRIINELNKDGIAIIGPDMELVTVPETWIKSNINPPAYKDIIFTDGHIIYSGILNAFDQYVDRTGEVIDNVTAWMEAPLPYEEE